MHRISFFLFLATLFFFSSINGWAGEDLLEAISVSESGEKVVAVANGNGVQVDVAAGSDDYPGVTLEPEGTTNWDLSGDAYVEARIRNTGEVELPVTLRVDNAGNWRDNPWNAESIRLGPGDSGTVRVYFGYSFGFQPSFALDASGVVAARAFTEKAGQPRSFLIESLTAGGIPGEDPREPEVERIAPADGSVFGPEAPVSKASQLKGLSGGSIFSAEDGEVLLVGFTAPGQSALFRPAHGVWDLRKFPGLKIRMRNMGSSSLHPKFQLLSRAGTGPVFTCPEEIAPGEEMEVPVPFSSPVPWTVSGDSRTGKMGTAPGTENDFGSDAVTGVSFLSGETGGEQSFSVLSIMGDVNPVPLPEWVGTRPPVEGDWVETFREEFDEDSLDESKWNIYTANYWDKKSHFSQDNVEVTGGKARLRFERKTGKHNDDPEGEVTDYQTGYLGTFGKWTQKYGYFEARMKLPEAPGLWPAFWMMPDRGPDFKPEWNRSSTGNGGMEFDILEYLSRWGPYRYNIAFHWDGYKKGHKSVGTSSVYAAHDSDGYVTAGLLWLPGKAEYYCNGQLVGRWESERVSSVPSYLIFTFVSGGWDNSPLDDGQLPADFLIDYVRCWQRTDLLK